MLGPRVERAVGDGKRFLFFLIASASLRACLVAPIVCGLLDPDDRHPTFFEDRDLGALDDTVADRLTGAA